MREQIFVTEKRRLLLSFTLEAILGGTSSSSKERRRLLEEREASSSALQFCVSTTAFTALTAKRKPQGRWRWRPVAFHRKTFSLDLNFSFRRTFWKKPYLFSNAIFFFKDKISIAKQFSWEYVWAHIQFLNRGPGREEIEGTCYLPTLSKYISSWFMNFVQQYTGYWKLNIKLIGKWEKSEGHSHSIWISLEKM